MQKDLFFFHGIDKVEICASLVLRDGCTEIVQSTIELEDTFWSMHDKNVFSTAESNWTPCFFTVLAKLNTLAMSDSSNHTLSHPELGLVICLEHSCIAS